METIAGVLATKSDCPTLFWSGLGMQNHSAVCQNRLHLSFQNLYRVPSSFGLKRAPTKFSKKTNCIFHIISFNQSSLTKIRKWVERQDNDGTWASQMKITFYWIWCIFICFRLFQLIFSTFDSSPSNFFLLKSCSIYCLYLVLNFYNCVKIRIFLLHTNQRD